MHSAHHFYNFNQLVSGFIAQNKKVTNNVHLMKFENLKTCGSLWGNNSNSTHVDWWTAKHHFSDVLDTNRTEIRVNQACALWSTREIYFRSAVLEVSRPEYLKLSSCVRETWSERISVRNKNREAFMEVEKY